MGGTLPAQRDPQTPGPPQAVTPRTCRVKRMAVSKWRGLSSSGTLSPFCHWQKLRSIWAALEVMGGPGVPWPSTTSRVTRSSTALPRLPWRNERAAAASTVSRYRRSPAPWNRDIVSSATTSISTYRGTEAKRCRGSGALGTSRICPGAPQHRPRPAQCKLAATDPAAAPRCPQGPASPGYSPGAGPGAAPGGGGFARPGPGPAPPGLSRAGVSRPIPVRPNPSQSQPVSVWCVPPHPGLRPSQSRFAVS